MKESSLAHKYLDGLKGIEIGGASHNPFGLNTINVDITENSLSSRKSAEQGLKPMHVDVVANGDDLPFEDNSYDFVISSHVIEHFYDPIKAIKEWARVAKKYIFIICPHKDRMFDRDKKNTTVCTLYGRQDNPKVQTDFSHQSYWDTECFVYLLNELKDGIFEDIVFDIIEVQDPDDKVGNGFSVVIKLY
jgi:SAM-dependent methyltransferase